MSDLFSIRELAAVGHCGVVPLERAAKQFKHTTIVDGVKLYDRGTSLDIMKATGQMTVKTTKPATKLSAPSQPAPKPAAPKPATTLAKPTGAELDSKLQQIETKLSELSESLDTRLRASGVKPAAEKLGVDPGALSGHSESLRKFARSVRFKTPKGISK